MFGASALGARLCGLFAAAARVALRAIAGRARDGGETGSRRSVPGRSKAREKRLCSLIALRKIVGSAA